MHRRAFVSLLGSTGLASLAAGSLPARVLAGACAGPSFSPGYLGGAEVPVKRGGAILVSLTMGFGGDGRSSDPLAGAYTLRSGSTSIPLHVERTAPGLLRLVPARFTAGQYTVQGPAGERAVTLVDAPAATVAPAFLERVSLVRSPGTQQPYSPATWSLRARLREGLPANVAGLLVALETPNAPYTLFAPWSAAGERDVPLYHSPGRCGADVPGVSPPSVGNVIRVTVIDAGGAVSVRSNHVEIRE